jgi:uncharacterized Zn finger protein
VVPELEEIFAAAGAPLFPKHASDLNQRCSCPDSEVPCKHLAATFYLLAEAFDTDPFVILRWRGRDREALLARLRELRASEPAAATVDGTPRRPGAALALTGITQPPADPNRFWLPPPPLPPRPPALETDPALLLRQLPAPDATLGGAGLIGRLRQAYERFAE